MQKKWDCKTFVYKSLKMSIKLFQSMLSYELAIIFALFIRRLRLESEVK